MDNIRRELHSYLMACAKTSLGVCLTELSFETCLIQLVHFGAGNKKAMQSSSKVVHVQANRMQSGADS